MHNHVEHRTTVISKQLSRRFQVLLICLGAAIGVVAGLVVSFYRLSLAWAERTLRSIIDMFEAYPALIVLWFGALIALAAVLAYLVKREPDTEGSGIPQIDAEVIGKMDMNWKHVLPTKFIEGVICAFGGLSLGREGPSVMLGGMAGKMVSKLSGRSRGEERLAITCGAAAGMSAAFHAPLTGVLFALEEIHKEFSAPLIISVMAASVAGDFIVSQILGIAPVLKLQFLADLPHLDYAWIIALAIYTGILGALHNRGMFGAQSLYQKIPSKDPFWRFVIPFMCAGIVALFAPILLDGGDKIIELVESPAQLSLSLVVLLLIGKYLFTTISFASGAPGGTLFPLVVLGSLAGALFNLFASKFFGFSPLYTPNFVVFGVVGLFSSVVRAPVTGVVLAFELTGSLDALLSVSIVSVISYLTANICNIDGFYEHLLHKLLLKLPGGCAADKSQDAHKVLLRFKVGYTSSLCGQKVSDIPWPDGSRLVIIDRAGAELIPTGETVLEALDEFEVIVSSKNEEDARLKISAMCGSRFADLHTYHAIDFRHIEHAVKRVRRAHALHVRGKK